MANLQITIQSVHRDAVAVRQITPRQTSAEVSGATSIDKMMATSGSSVSVPLGAIIAPILFYIFNASSENTVIILDDATEIGRVPPGQQSLQWLPSGVDIKVQSITADAEINFAVYGAA